MAPGKCSTLADMTMIYEFKNNNTVYSAIADLAPVWQTMQKMK